MKHLPMTHVLLALMLAAGCAASASELRSSDAHRSAAYATPVASEGFRLVWKEKESPGVGDLLAEYARVTGQTVFTTGETDSLIRRKRLEKAGGSDVLEISAEDVQEITEALLIMHQFVMIPVHDGEPRMVQVLSLETQERNFIRRSAVFVPSEELEAWRVRRAALITTSVRLANTDVRTLSNSMRTMLTDANTQQIIPVGNSNSLILTGYGRDICELVDMLRRIDAQAATEPAG